MRRLKPPTCRCLRRRCRRLDTRGRRRFKKATLIRRLRLSMAIRRRVSAMRIRRGVLLVLTGMDADPIGAAITGRVTATATRTGAVPTGADRIATGESVCFGNPESSRTIPIASPARRNSGNLYHFATARSSGGINGNAALMLHRFCGCLFGRELSPGGVRGARLCGSMCHSAAHRTLLRTGQLELGAGDFRGE